MTENEAKISLESTLHFTLNSGLFKEKSQQFRVIWQLCKKMENLVVCRFCGAFKSPADIFCDINNIEEEKGSRSITLQEQVSSFFKVKLDNDKSLPQSICTFCRLQIEVCFGYGSNLKKVQQQLESPQVRFLETNKIQTHFNNFF